MVKENRPPRGRKGGETYSIDIKNKHIKEEMNIIIARNQKRIIVSRSIRAYRCLMPMVVFLGRRLPETRNAR